MASTPEIAAHRTWPAITAVRSRASLGWPSWHWKTCRSRSLPSALDDPQFAVDDDTLVVAQTFRLLEGPS
jgi:hypothetical protein